MPKPIGTPIDITLYDEESEGKRFTRAFVPWKIMKLAIRLVKSLNVERPEDIDENAIDAIGSLVVEAFGNQFSIQELEDGADISDMLAVLEQIVNKAQGLVPNPPPAN